MSLYLQLRPDESSVYSGEGALSSSSTMSRSALKVVASVAFLLASTAKRRFPDTRLWTLGLERVWPPLGTLAAASSCDSSPLDSADSAPPVSPVGSSASAVSSYCCLGAGKSGVALITYLKLADRRTTGKTG